VAPGRLASKSSQDWRHRGWSLVRLLPGWASDAVDAHALYSSHRSLSAKVRVFIGALIDHLRHHVTGGSTTD